RVMCGVMLVAAIIKRPRVLYNSCSWGMKSCDRVEVLRRASRVNLKTGRNDIIQRRSIRIWCFQKPGSGDRIGLEESQKLVRNNVHPGGMGMRAILAKIILRPL